MKKLLRSAGIAIIAALTVGGCSLHQLDLRTDAGVAMPHSESPVQFDIADMWWGLSEADEIDASQFCDSVARVETEHSFVQQLISSLTIGIYTPMTVKVHCGLDEAGDVTQVGNFEWLYGLEYEGVEGSPAETRRCRVTAAEGELRRDYFVANRAEDASSCPRAGGGT